MKAPLVYGASYRALVRCSRFEKLLVNHAQMMDQLRRSGFEGVTFQSVKEGYRIQARYLGPSGEANLPGRVRSLMRLK
jgi:hypothetical protein